jgi:hypothetical protein
MRYIYEVYTRDFDFQESFDLSPMSCRTGIPLCWVACGGVLWCPRMVPGIWPKGIVGALNSRILTFRSSQCLRPFHQSNLFGNGEAVLKTRKR